MKGEKTMKYEVVRFDELVCDYEVVFEGTKEECEQYIQEWIDECKDFMTEEEIRSEYRIERK